MSMTRAVLLLLLAAGTCSAQDFTPLTKLAPVSQLELSEPENGYFTYDRSDIAAGDYESICRVVCPGGVGTGCYLSDGWVLTAKHVIEGEPTIHCEFRRERIKASRPYTCKFGNDVALLKLESIPANVPEQKISGTPPVVGDLVYLAGFDRGQPDTLRIYDGKVARIGDTMDIHGVGSRISIPGNSGGPVWNSNGEIITCISTRCDPGTPMYSEGRVVGYVQIGSSGTPNSQSVIDFARRVWAIGDETGEQIIGQHQPPQQCGPNGCPPRYQQPQPQPTYPQPNPSPSPQPQPIQPDCQCDEEAIAKRVLGMIDLGSLKGADAEVDYDKLVELVINRLPPTPATLSRDDVMGMIVQVLIESGSHSPIDSENLSEGVRVKPIWMRRENKRTGKVIAEEPIYPGEGWTFFEHPGIVNDAR